MGETMANEGGVAAVERALTILDAFRESDQSLTLTEISKRVGFYKSTTLRLAESLEKFGYLRRLEDGAFRLGPKPLFLGSLYQRHFRLAEFVPPVLRQIAAELNEGASFFVRENDQRVCVHRVESARAIRDVIHEGMRLPLELGAAGHVIMAFGGQPGARYDQVRRDLFSASFGERDPVDPAINHTTRVFCGGEFSIPLDNNGKNMDATEDYRSIFTCVDSESMEVRWQVLIDGNCDLVASSYDGKLACTNQYNTENGVHYEDMMPSEMDACLFFNVARIEEAVKAGKFKTYGGSKVPVVDGTKAGNPDPKTSLVCYVPVSKNPHGVNASPDGKYYACSGKLSPTATLIEHALVLKWFDGELKDAREAVVAEPEIGLGPLHTGFDGRGNAYTTLFLDSQIVKWNVEAAIKSYKGDKTAQPVVDRLDVHYQPGHGFTSMGETKDADGKYFLSDNKFSKDRFLPVGPLHPETGQLIDISGDKMKLVHDHSLYSEPHDSIIIPRNLIRTRQVYDLDEFPLATKDAKDCRVERKGKKVTVFLTSQAPAYGLREWRVKRGDEVTIILTNLDKVEDLTHGFAIPKYDINFIVNPQQTQSVTFIADKPGVYWCYCTSFCHALHLEMRSRMLVEA